MTIYQISTQDKEFLFDFALKDVYKDREDYLQNYKKQLGENIDVLVLNKKIEFLNSFDYIIIDREAFVNEDRYVVQMIKSLLSFINKAKPIFIWKSIPNEYLKELIEVGISNIIISDNLDEQKQEILECFSDKGMQRYNKNWKTSGSENYEKYVFKEQEIYCIQIMTTDNDLKSKSISLSLCQYINNVGGKVTLNCPNYSDNVIQAMAKLLNAEKEDNYYYKDNIYLSNDINFEFYEKGCNFYVRDIGFINEYSFNQNLDMINQEMFDKNIVLCDLNILEVDIIRAIMQNLSDKTYIANSYKEYITEDRINELNGIDRDYFSLLDKQSRIKRLEKQDDIIEIRNNRNFYHMLIEPFIITTDKG